MFLVEFQHYSYLSLIPPPTPGRMAVTNYKLKKIYQRTSFSTFSLADRVGFLVVHLHYLIFILGRI